MVTGMALRWSCGRALCLSHTTFSTGRRFTLRPPVRRRRALLARPCDGPSPAISLAPSIRQLTTNCLHHNRRSDRLCGLQWPCLRRPQEVPVQLRISTRTIDGVLIVDCNGRLVFGEESANLRDTVKKLISENKNIVLNLSGVSYIDSGGLGTLVALYTSAQTNGGKIKLASLTPRVGDLLQVTKLVTIFEVYDNEEQAVQSFRRGAAA